MDPNMDSTPCQLQKNKLLTDNPGMRGAQLVEANFGNKQVSITVPVIRNHINE